MTGPGVNVPEVPLDSSTLRAWAEAHGVASMLDRKVNEPGLGLLDGYAYHLTYLPEASVHDVLVTNGSPFPGRRWLPKRLARGLVTELRTKLWRLASQRACALAAEATRQEGWTQRRQKGGLPEPLCALVDSLIAARAKALASLPVTPAEAGDPSDIAFTLRPLGAKVTGTDHRYYVRWSVHVDLAAFPAPPQIECNLHPRRGCIDQVVALAFLIDGVLAAKGSRVPAGLLKELERPAWERFLEAASPTPDDGAGIPAQSERRQLATSWRVRVKDGEAGVGPVAHKLTKNGSWSPGSEITTEAVLRNALNQVAPVDRQPLEMWAAGFGVSPHSQAAQRLKFRTLELLVGHPQVFTPSDFGFVVLRLERASLGLQVESDPDGALRPRVSLAGSHELGRQAVEALARRREALVIEPATSPGHTRGFLLTAEPDSLRLLEAVERYHPSLPAQAGPELMARLAPIESRLTLHLPPELQGVEVPPDPVPVLRLRLEESPEGAPDHALELEVIARPLPGGTPQVPGQGAPELSRFGVTGRIRVRRDLPAEEAAAQALLARLPLPGADSPSRWQRRLAALDDALDLVGHLESLPAEGPTAVRVEWLEAVARLTRTAKVDDLRVVISDQRDWFGLEGGIEIDGERVALALLLEAARRHARYVQVRPGKWMALSQELRERLGAAADVVHRGRQGLEVSAAAAPALSDLLDAAGERKLSVRWRALVKRLAAAKANTYPLPEGIQAQLRPYQREGFAWMLRLADCGMGALLADDMGLGKTVQALGVLLARAQLGPALVVAPTSVCFNWEREAARYAPDLEVARYQGPRDERWANLEELAPGEVVVASYGVLVEDAERFQKVRWSTLVLDEAQALKNAATRRARTVRDLQADWSVALTGTPVENHVGELWSLFRIISPGLLGSWEQFRERFARPIERHQDPERRAALARVVRPFILRRTKGEVARELPSRTEIQLPVTLSRGERRLYDDARLAALARLKGLAGEEGDHRFQVLAALTRLRQLACHPRLYDPESAEHSSKLEKLLEVVSELREEGHRALVFSQFTSHLALVREALDAQKISYGYLDGATPARQREARVDAFQRGEGDLFLISLKAGGTGLNLTGADYVIHLDPWWNPAVEDQATDRAHRIGQAKPVTVYRLVAQGTIEEAILAMHAEKRDLVAGLLDGTDRAGKLTTEQLVELIRSGAATDGAETADDALGDLAVPEKPAEPSLASHLRLVTRDDRV